MKFLVGYHTDNGIRRKENQDSLLIKTASSSYGRIGLFLICDGMGGLSKGELASATVVREFNMWFDKDVKEMDFNSLDDDEVYNILDKKIKELNEKILDYGNGIGERLGTTLTMMFSIDRKAYIFQVGDSRVYKVSDELEQLTVDQTFVQREIDRGNITKEEGINHPRKNVLLQCIGAKKKVEVKMDVIEINENEVYIICSDGFYRRLKETEIIENFNYKSINKESDISSKLKNLCEVVKLRKEQDNISAIVVRTL